MQTEELGMQSWGLEGGDERGDGCMFLSGGLVIVGYKAVSP